MTAPGGDVNVQFKAPGESSTEAPKSPEDGTEPDRIAAAFVEDPDQPEPDLTSNDSEDSSPPEDKPLVADLAKPKVVDISEVSPYERNPRKIPQKAVEIVAESLKRFGWQQPLVVDKDGVLVVGHTRMKAAQYLGLTKVPVVVAENLTDREVEAYRIADNRTGDFTSWDLPELVEQLENLADDFSDVLGLEDWRTLVDEFEDMSLNLSSDAATDMGGNGFEITVVFKDKDSALAAELSLMDLPGAMDVRHKLKAQYGK
jgi:hypothetical protein